MRYYVELSTHYFQFRPVKLYPIVDGVVTDNDGDTYLENDMVDETGYVVQL